MTDTDFIDEDALERARAEQYDVARLLLTAGAEIFAGGSAHSLSQAVGMAKRELLSLLRDSDVADVALELTPHEQRSPVLRRRLLGRE